jgi:hypothetical protein
MEFHSRSTAGIVTATCALFLGAVSGCTEVKDPMATQLAVRDAALSTVVACDGTFNCELPNPSPCAEAGSGGLGRLAHPDDPTDCTFSIKPRTVLYSGSGLPIGIISDAEVAVNFGQRRSIPSVRIDPGGGIPHENGQVYSAVFVPDAATDAGVASGWVRESSFRESLAFMPTVTGADPGEGDYVTTWRFTGGTDEVKADYAGMAFGDGHTPLEYLGRPAGEMLVLYDLPGMGGVASDSYLLDEDVSFHRSKGVLVEKVPYFPQGAPQGSTPAGYMQFMYGHVGDRYGWVARDGATSATTCDGPFNCKLPNPNPCKASGGGGSNRAAHPDNPKDCSFTVAPGTVMRDGFGTARGTLISTQVKINYGQRKVLPNGESAVYVWDAVTDDGHQSGWIYESSLTESLAIMPTVAAADPGQGDYPRTFVITGGSESRIAYYDQMVLCADVRPCGPAPNHYMLRPGGVMNIIWSLPGVGGVSNDTYLVEGAAVHFRRAKGVPLLSVPYYDKDSPAGSPAVGQMQFMYGHVGDRYGWVAVEALSG